MKTRTGALVLLIAVAGLVSAQQAPPAVPIIKIGLDLVQIDAAVVDREGRPVTDLRPEDFTIEVDGHKQAVSNSAYFGAKAPSAVSPAASVMGTDTSPTADTVVFIVDDLNMSFASMYYARRALSTFAASWSPQGAMVGMRVTSDEGSSFSVYRSSEPFAKAVEGLHYIMRSSQGISSVPEARRDYSLPIVRGGTSASMSPDAAMAMSGVNPTINYQNLQQRVFSLVSTIDRLRTVPGRKAVVFLSEGFYVSDPRDRDNLGFNSPYQSLFDDHDVQSALRLITEIANRASVVLYAVDPRGLMYDGPTAADDVSPEQATSLASSRWSARVESQGSLHQLAGDTGGIAVVNTNGLHHGFQEILRDHSEYYLIGFEPPEKAFAKTSGRPKFHSIKLRVNRPGVHVRTRAGFYGVTDKEVGERAPLFGATEH